MKITYTYTHTHTTHTSTHMQINIKFMVFICGDALCNNFVLLGQAIGDYGSLDLVYTSNCCLFLISFFSRFLTNNICLNILLHINRKKNNEEKIFLSKINLFFCLRIVLTIQWRQFENTACLRIFFLNQKKKKSYALVFEIVENLKFKYRQFSYTGAWIYNTQCC